MIDKANEEYPEAHRDIPNEVTINLVKAPKDHIIDIGKVAAGITVALIIDRFIKRKK